MRIPRHPYPTVFGAGARRERSFVGRDGGRLLPAAGRGKNRLFVTAALRADANSAFGEQFKAAYYPKLSASWVVHEEPWFTYAWVDEFRLRGAWGAAGQQPATFAAARLYGPQIGYQNQPALSPSAYGNPDSAQRGEDWSSLRHRS